jgi:hypothetical protein
MRLVLVRAVEKAYRAPMALPSASTVSKGAGVLALGVATLVVFVVLAMLADERSEYTQQVNQVQPCSKQA